MALHFQAPHSHSGSQNILHGTLGHCWVLYQIQYMPTHIIFFLPFPVQSTQNTSDIWMRNAHHRVRYLNVQSFLVDGAALGEQSWNGAALLKKVRMSLRASYPLSIHRLSLSPVRLLCFACTLQGMSSPLPVPATKPAYWHAFPPRWALIPPEP